MDAADSVFEQSQSPNARRSPQDGAFDNTRPPSSSAPLPSGNITNQKDSNRYRPTGTNTATGAGDYGHPSDYHQPALPRLGGAHQQQQQQDTGHHRKVLSPNQPNAHQRVEDDTPVMSPVQREIASSPHGGRGGGGEGGTGPSTRPGAAADETSNVNTYNNNDDGSGRTGIIRGKNGAQSADDGGAEDNSSKTSVHLTPQQRLHDMTNDRHIVPEELLWQGFAAKEIREFIDNAVRMRFYLVRFSNHSGTEKEFQVSEYSKSSNLIQNALFLIIVGLIVEVIVRSSRGILEGKEAFMLIPAVALFIFETLRHHKARSLINQYDRRQLRFSAFNSSMKWMVTGGEIIASLTVFLVFALFLFEIIVSSGPGCGSEQIESPKMKMSTNEIIYFDVAESALKVATTYSYNNDPSVALFCSHYHIPGLELAASLVAISRRPFQFTAMILFTLFVIIEIFVKVYANEFESQRINWRFPQDTIFSGVLSIVMLALQGYAERNSRVAFANRKRESAKIAQLRFDQVQMQKYVEELVPKMVSQRILRHQQRKDASRLSLHNLGDVDFNYNTAVLAVGLVDYIHFANSFLPGHVAVSTAFVFASVSEVFSNVYVPLSTPRHPLDSSKGLPYFVTHSGDNFVAVFGLGRPSNNSTGFLTPSESACVQRSLLDACTYLHQLIQVDDAMRTHSMLTSEPRPQLSFAVHCGPVLGEIPGRSAITWRYGLGGQGIAVGRRILKFTNGKRKRVLVSQAVVDRLDKAVLEIPDKRPSIVPLYETVDVPPWILSGRQNMAEAARAQNITRAAMLALPAPQRAAQPPQSVHNVPSAQGGNRNPAQQPPTSTAPQPSGIVPMTVLAYASVVIDLQFTPDFAPPVNRIVRSSVPGDGGYGDPLHDQRPSSPNSRNVVSSPTGLTSSTSQQGLEYSGYSMEDRQRQMTQPPFDLDNHIDHGNGPAGGISSSLANSSHPNDHQWDDFPDVAALQGIHWSNKETALDRSSLLPKDPWIASIVNRSTTQRGNNTTTTRAGASTVHGALGGNGQINSVTSVGYMGMSESVFNRPEVLSKAGNVLPELLTETVKHSNAVLSSTVRRGVEGPYKLQPAWGLRWLRRLFHKLFSLCRSEARSPRRQAPVAAAVASKPGTTLTTGRSKGIRRPPGNVTSIVATPPANTNSKLHESDSSGGENSKSSPDVLNGTSAVVNLGGSGRPDPINNNGTKPEGSSSSPTFLSSVFAFIADWMKGLYFAIRKSTTPREFANAAIERDYWLTHMFGQICVRPFVVSQVGYVVVCVWVCLISILDLEIFMKDSSTEVPTFGFKIPLTCDLSSFQSSRIGNEEACRLSYNTGTNCSLTTDNELSCPSSILNTAAPRASFVRYSPALTYLCGKLELNGRHYAAFALFALSILCACLSVAMRLRAVRRIRNGIRLPESGGSSDPASPNYNSTIVELQSVNNATMGGGGGPSALTLSNRGVSAGPVEGASSMRFSTVTIGDTGAVVVHHGNPDGNSEVLGYERLFREQKSLHFEVITSVYVLPILTPMLLLVATHLMYPSRLSLDFFGIVILYSVLIPFVAWPLPYILRSMIVNVIVYIPLIIGYSAIPAAFFSRPYVFVCIGLTVGTFLQRNNMDQGERSAYIRLKLRADYSNALLRQKEARRSVMETAIPAPLRTLFDNLRKVAKNPRELMSQQQQQDGAVADRVTPDLPDGAANGANNNTNAAPNTSAANGQSKQVLSPGGASHQAGGTPGNNELTNNQQGGAGNSGVASPGSLNNNNNGSNNQNGGAVNGEDERAQKAPAGGIVMSAVDVSVAVVTIIRCDTFHTPQLSELACKLFNSTRDRRFYTSGIQNAMEGQDMVSTFMAIVDAVLIDFPILTVMEVKGDEVLIGGPWVTPQSFDDEDEEKENDDDEDDEDEGDGQQKRRKTGLRGLMSDDDDAFSHNKKKKVAKPKKSVKIGGQVIADANNTNNNNATDNTVGSVMNQPTTQKADTEEERRKKSLSKVARRMAHAQGFAEHSLLFLLQLKRTVREIVERSSSLAGGGAVGGSGMTTTDSSNAPLFAPPPSAYSSQHTNPPNPGSTVNALSVLGRHADGATMAMPHPSATAGVHLLSEQNVKAFERASNNTTNNSASGEGTVALLGAPGGGQGNNGGNAGKREQSISMIAHPGGVNDEMSTASDVQTFSNNQSMNTNAPNNGALVVNGQQQQVRPLRGSLHVAAAQQLSAADNSFTSLAGAGSTAASSVVGATGVPIVGLTVGGASLHPNTQQTSLQTAVTAPGAVSPSTPLLPTNNTTTGDRLFSPRSAASGSENSGTGNAGPGSARTHKAASTSVTNIKKVSSPAARPLNSSHQNSSTSNSSRKAPPAFGFSAVTTADDAIIMLRNSLYPSFDVLGTGPLRCRELIRAAAPGTIAFTESFRDVLLSNEDSPLYKHSKHGPLLKPPSPREGCVTPPPPPTHRSDGGAAAALRETDDPLYFRHTFDKPWSTPPPLMPSAEGFIPSRTSVAHPLTMETAPHSPEDLRASLMQFEGGRWGVSGLSMTRMWVPRPED